VIFFYESSDVCKELCGNIVTAATVAKAFLVVLRWFQMIWLRKASSDLHLH